MNAPSRIGTALLRPDRRLPSELSVHGHAPSPFAGVRTLGFVYDHDPEEVEELGREEFIARQWESIFAGYRSWAGLRKTARRWSDLVEAGLDCSQGIADRLVRAQVIDRADRDLEGTADADAVVSGMVGVLADMRAELTEMIDLGPGSLARLLDRHSWLLNLVRAHAFGQDVSEAPGL
jgi:hypothetical protein